MNGVGNAKTGGLYAMKTLRKSHVVERKQVAHVIAEKDILAEADNDWIVKLYYSFQVSYTSRNTIACFFHVFILKLIQINLIAKRIMHFRIKTICTL